MYHDLSVSRALEPPVGHLHEGSALGEPGSEVAPECLESFPVSQREIRGIVPHVEVGYDVMDRPLLELCLALEFGVRERLQQGAERVALITEIKRLLEHLCSPGVRPQPGFRREQVQKTICFKGHCSIVWVADSNFA